MTKYTKSKIQPQQQQQNVIIIRKIPLSVFYFRYFDDGNGTPERRRSDEWAELKRHSFFFGFFEKKL